MEGSRDREERQKELGAREEAGRWGAGTEAGKQEERAGGLPAQAPVLSQAGFPGPAHSRHSLTNPSTMAPPAVWREQHS